MARGGHRKKSPARRGTKRAKPKQSVSKKQLRHEKALSKKLGYSVTRFRQQRERASSKRYIETAKKLAPFVPELKKLSKETKLTSAQKARVTHYGKSLKHVFGNLRPIPKKLKKSFEGADFMPGVNAIALGGFSGNATVKSDGKDLIVVSNGRTWILWKLDKDIIHNKKKIDKAAADAFQAKFPVEIIAQLAEKAFAKLKVKSVTLWITSGRKHDTFTSLKQFLIYLHSEGHGLKSDPDVDPAKFIKGLAIEIEEPPKSKKKKKK